MKRSYIFLGIFALYSFLSISCEKNEGDITGGVELYLLESYENIGQTCGIELSSVVTKEEPLIRYVEFKSYNAKDFAFKITDIARGKIDSLEHSVLGIPFAVTADQEVIYTGYFWPGYSSAMCEWIVIDPLLLIWREKNTMWLELGYPGLIEGTVIPDERNNEKILNIFRRDNKLIE